MLYDIFAIVAVLIGVSSAIFLARRAWANRQSKVLSVNMLVLALCNLWVSGVYVTTLFYFSDTHLTIGVYIRPAMILLLLIPAQLVRGLRL